MLETNISLDERARKFYTDALKLLNDCGKPFLVGGAYALAHHAGVERHTRDLDIFIHKRDVEEILQMFTKWGFRSEMTFSHWLGKAFKDDHYIDLIFSSGNAIADVDNEWFTHAVDANVFGVPVRLCPPEEMIWSKGFIMERERFDGADVAHIFRSCGETMDWDRLLRRFGPHWRILLTHMILFGFIYPNEKNRINERVLKLLTDRLKSDSESQNGAQFNQGVLLSREQYLPDIEQWGYEDARLKPHGNMSDSEIDVWTIAIKSR